MNTIDASLRNTKTSGEVNKLRSEGNVPGIVYGGKSETQKISISKKLLKSLIEEILKECPISTPSKSTTSSLGMFSDGHFSSTFLRTIFNTPPLFKPGDFSVLINLPVFQL